MQQEQMPFGPVPDQDRTGHRIAGRPLLLAVPGGGCQDGKNAEDQFRQLLTACLCVCVCCVSPLTVCVD